MTVSNAAAGLLQKLNFLLEPIDIVAMAISSSMIISLDNAPPLTISPSISLGVVEIMPQRGML